MDDFTTDLFVSRSGSPERATSSKSDERATRAEQATPTTPTPAPKTLRQKMAAIRDKASIQDRLLEKLLSQIVPTDATPPTAASSEGLEAYEARPHFTISTMSNNFRRFNARIGVVFSFQEQAVRVLTWHHPSHTLSLLAVYSFICLDPHLLPILPLAIMLLAIFIPAFLARHPAPRSGPETLVYSPKGPATAPPLTVKPAKELSRDFLQNMRDLQNCMDDFCVVHDALVSTVVPITNFSSEAQSTFLFVSLFFISILMSISAHLLPWRIIFLATGWLLIASNHPFLARLITATHQQHINSQEAAAKSWLEAYVQADILLDSAPETRETEVFELQRINAETGEWEPWLFSPTPWNPLSQQRISQDRPRGTRFFEEVLPPEGWEWSEKKWALDLWSREWVEDRIITGVEVETEGERWVYDMAETEGKSPVYEGSQEETQSSTYGSLEGAGDWDEVDAVGRRGEWRRRRWVRVVKRVKVEEEQS